MNQNKALGDVLSRVKKAADENHTSIVHTSDLTRADREFLVKNGWLQGITRGWYMLVRPDVASGDSGAWYVNYWDFIRLYMQDRFATDYCLSAQASIDVILDKPRVPEQIVAIVKRGGGQPIQLPHGTSILAYDDPQKIPDEKIEMNGLQVMPLPLALCKSSVTYFQKNPEDAEIALRSIENPLEIVKYIEKYGSISVANRMIGAYEFIGEKSIAAVLKSDLDKLFVRIKPNNPFESDQPILLGGRIKSPYAGRIEAIWSQARQIVLDLFPKEPGLPKNSKAYFKDLELIYEYDAYNSLSIEGYRVSNDLIARVQSDDWNPDKHQEDALQRDAMAARGYYDAFNVVKFTLDRILSGENPGKCFESDLSLWYQKLFAPSVQAGILSVNDLSGYRNDRVFIRNSLHAPPPKEAVLDSMEVFFKCLANEKSAAVGAVVGHYVFVYIHPYMDGNGRIARFLMNSMFASGGFPWTVINANHRKQYIDALESAHAGHDLELFTKCILREMDETKAFIKNV